MLGRIFTSLGRASGALVSRATGHAGMLSVAGRMQWPRRLTTQPVSLANLRPAPGSRKPVRIYPGVADDHPTK